MRNNLFAHKNHAVRLQAAIAMLTARRARLLAVTLQLDSGLDAITRSVLLQQQSALRSSVRSWEEYIEQGCPIEHRAQMTLAFDKKRAEAADKATKTG